MIGLAGCARGAPAPRGTVGVTLEDGRLSAAVRTALLNDPQLGLRKIAVETRLGVVTLTGSVEYQEEVAARAAARRERCRRPRSAIVLENPTLTRAPFLTGHSPPVTCRIPADPPRVSARHRPTDSHPGCPGFAAKRHRGHVIG